MLCADAVNPKPDADVLFTDAVASKPDADAPTPSADTAEPLGSGYGYDPLVDEAVAKPDDAVSVETASAPSVDKDELVAFTYIVTVAGTVLISWSV